MGYLDPLPPNWVLTVYQYNTTTVNIQGHAALYTHCRPMYLACQYCVAFCSLLAGLYLMYLLLLSFTLLYGATKADPTQYKDNADGLRMVCEIFVVLCIVAYIADEINEIEK